MTVRQFLAGCAIGCVLLGSAATAGAAPAKRRTARTHATARPRIDLNSAPKARLTTLPGVDETTADKIIAGRPYTSGNELVSRNVLSSEAFDKIKGRVVARKATPKKAARRKRRATRKAQAK